VPAPAGCFRSRMDDIPDLTGMSVRHHVLYRMASGEAGNTSFPLLISWALTKRFDSTIRKDIREILSECDERVHVSPAQVAAARIVSTTKPALFKRW
jgi:hypothetical protein